MNIVLIKAIISLVLDKKDDILINKKVSILYKIAKYIMREGVAYEKDADFPEPV